MLSWVSCLGAVDVPPAITLLFTFMRLFVVRCNCYDNRFIIMKLLNSYKPIRKDMLAKCARKGKIVGEFLSLSN